MQQQESEAEFIKKLLSHPLLLKEKKLYSRLLGKDVIWIITLPLNEGCDIKRGTEIKKILSEQNKCEFLASNKKILSKCKSCIIENFAKAQNTKKSQRFRCQLNLFGVCLPLIYKDKLYGLLGVCHAGRNLNENFISLLVTFIEALLENVYKELELSRLYETIRPRAIALSTIHTVHRIIGSTLNLDELLPKLARLSLQALRANRCTIMMNDKENKYLIPKTVIDISKKHTKSRKVKIGYGIMGKVAKDGVSLCGRNYICVPLIEEEVTGVIEIKNKQNKKPFTISEQEILTVFAEQAVVAINNAQLYEEQRKVIVGSIKSIASVLDAKILHEYTHSIEFSKIVLELGKECDLNEEEMKSLEYASYLRDAGKIGIPEEILTKPTFLTGKEFKIVKTHPERGAKLIKPLEVLKPTIPIILHHHEKYDGTGYPHHLKGEQIPLGARIMAVADTFEAMITTKSYKGAMSVSNAVEEVKKNSGTQFDPKVVNAFLKLVKKGTIKKILNKRKPLKKSMSE